MTDNPARVAAAPARSLISVDGIVTERTYPDSYTTRIVLTDGSGSLTVTIPCNATGGTEAYNTLDLGMFALIAGRIENQADGGQEVLAAVVEFTDRKTTRELMALPDLVAEVLGRSRKAIGS
ncbi:OB-fold nucleic acid binding domain-containing protein [Kitasatospora sp. NPDC058184]|uniref:OB-fold nucleic acid binding domain-containing protein n=1 Tax=Kitasatospora sp. NPDC058184 TaxID=3346370 RepID=UPI0036D9669C